MSVGIRKKKPFFLLLAHKITRINKHSLILVGSIFFSWVILSFSLILTVNAKVKGASILGINLSNLKEFTKSRVIKAAEITITVPLPTSTPTSSPTPTYTPTLTPTITPKPTKTPSLTPATKIVDTTNNNVQQVNDFTFKVSNVENDSSMASPNDVFNYLNSYRNQKGAGPLSWDTGLSDYAQGRANLFSSKGELDGHAGFSDFMNNDGFSKVGFNSLGENSAYLSGPMNAEKIVRNIFGADSLHDGNQLDNWTHVGIGINGNAVNVNFGKGKR